MQQVLFSQPNEFAAKAVCDYSGKDLLNLSEFPLALGSQRIPSNLQETKTIIYEDIIVDSSTKQKIRRRQTVVGGDQLGLPTKFDDEVLVALMQISAEHGFASDTIPYTHYGIAKKLKKNVDGKTLSRIEQSVSRWLAVTVYYENAWWNPKGGWESHDFHILESRHKNSDSKNYEIRWNPLVFKSMQRGRVGTMDWETFLHLKNSLSRQIFRLLLKRFKNRKSKFTWDIVEFGHRKMGLQSMQPGQLKKKLKPALKELEEYGILKSDEKSPWFIKVGTKGWEIRLEPGDAYVFDDNKKIPQPKVTSELLDSLTSALIKHGVSEKVATKLVKSHSSEKIKLQLDYLKYLKNNTPEIKNPGGHLVTAIKDEYSAPTGYKAAVSRKRNKVKNASATARKRREQVLLDEFQKIATEQRGRAEKILELLSVKKKELINDRVSKERKLEVNFEFFELHVLDHIVTEELGVTSFLMGGVEEYKASNGITGYPELKEFLVESR